ncbi:hypothetical protein NPIL_417291 [Nephila pilipes]|uniref:Uncharacterized protein n=1 Tax=Nephila pilipes TaxID=299642 RepID=A0A8X6MHD1_NEPPI|nr:hypothetical protein NPIL_417291 [Nephila pilipes]
MAVRELVIPIDMGSLEKGLSKEFARKEKDRDMLKNSIGIGTLLLIQTDLLQERLINQYVPRFSSLSLLHLLSSSTVDKRSFHSKDSVFIRKGDANLYIFHPQADYAATTLDSKITYPFSYILFLILVSLNSVIKSVAKMRMYFLFKRSTKEVVTQEDSGYVRKDDVDLCIVHS